MFKPKPIMATVCGKRLLQDQRATAMSFDRLQRKIQMDYEWFILLMKVYMIYFQVCNEVLITIIQILTHTDNPGTEL